MSQLLNNEYIKLNQKNSTKTFMEACDHDGTGIKMILVHKSVKISHKASDALSDVFTVMLLQK